MDQTTTPTGTAKPRPRDSATGAVRVSTRKSPPKKRYIGANGFGSDVATLRAAVQRCQGRAQTEASGGITLESVCQIAETGVNFISVGALTHSARAVDIGLDFEI